MRREIGPNGLALTQHCEGVVYQVYLDSSGFKTAGVGHLVRQSENLNVGDPVSEEQVQAWLQSDLADARSCVNRRSLDLTQNQFDALCDFAFNAGCANLIQLITMAGTVEAIPEQFLHYLRSGTDHPRGLLIRRLLERDLFRAPDGPMPDGWLTKWDGVKSVHDVESIA